MGSLYSYEYEPYKEETDDEGEYNNFTVDDNEKKRVQWSVATKKEEKTFNNIWINWFRNQWIRWGRNKSCKFWRYVYNYCWKIENVNLTDIVSSVSHVIISHGWVSSLQQAPLFYSDLSQILEIKTFLNIQKFFCRRKKEIFLRWRTFCPMKNFVWQVL